MRSKNLKKKPRSYWQLKAARRASKHPISISEQEWMVLQRGWQKEDRDAVEEEAEREVDVQ